MSKELPMWLTVQQVMDLTQLSRSHVYALVEDGKIPHRRFGTRIRIDRNYINPDYNEDTQQEDANNSWPPKTLIQKQCQNSTSIDTEIACP